MSSVSFTIFVCNQNTPGINTKLLNIVITDAVKHNGTSPFTKYVTTLAATDEGLTEKESLDVMLSLTLEEIDEALQLDEITGGLLMKAAKAAEVARGKAAVMGNKQLAMKKLGQGEKFYKGAVAKKKAAGQMGAGYKEGM